VVGAFKAASSRLVNQYRGTPGGPVWQRGFYEHVVRDEADLERIRRSIEENPLRWAEDDENLSRVHP
jgi:REP element-mobilizing transposase RayT